MKTAMKKLFSLVLVAALLVSAVPTAFADDGGIKCAEHPDSKITRQPAYDNATCTEAGKAGYYCHEGSHIVRGEDIPALGHTPGNAATCTSNQVCTVCGTELAAALNHTPGDPATCTSNQSCTVCGTELAATLDHTPGDPATCTTNQACTVCGTELAAVLGHTPGDAATCTTNQVCIVCGTELAGELGHNFVNGVCTNGCGIAENKFCEECGAPSFNGMCTGCYLDEFICTCNQTTTPEDTTGKVKVYLNLNYGDAYKYGEEMEYVWAEENALLKDVIGNIAAPNRDKHHFQYWSTDLNGTNVIDEYNNEARVTADGVMIYAQWVDIVQSTKGKVDLRINLNYGNRTSVMENIVRGTKMSEVLKYVGNPVRLNHKFVGWYWDEDCKNAVKSNDKIYDDEQIFAKWEYRKTNNEIMLKIYLNDNTKSVAKIVDMYSYSTDDDAISLSEVKKVVKKYYTSRNSDGMYFEGLFDTNDWSTYVYNSRSIDGSKYIDVNEDDDTVIYVMVHNAKTRTTSSSSGTADSSNPKTGDMIFNAVTVMGASAACLAALFYLNKKRAY